MKTHKPSDTLTFDEYESTAIKTDQYSPHQTRESIANSIANLTEEVGALLRWYEQDGHAGEDLTLFTAKAPAKIGDILWYLASIAGRVNVSLADIAQANLTKAAKRYPRPDKYALFDEQFPPDQQIPRQFTFKVNQRPEDKKVVTWIDTEVGPWYLGDPVDDNAYDDDGYRFHDVLHFAYAAYLGWSPVLRQLMRRKRKADPTVDRVEDGARARDLEEALTAFIYEHAKTEDLFAGKEQVDFKIIKQAERLTMTREVQARSPEHWKEAILGGYRVFRQVLANRGGIIAVDLAARTYKYQPFTKEATSTDKPLKRRRK